jgi:hypothetical protein
MSENGHNDDSRKRVPDEEGTVDAKIKTQIIQSRNRVNRAEQELFVEAEVDPSINIPRNDRVVIWGTIVKQYLREIEPILRSDEVQNATEYYKHKEIGEVNLIPPDTDGYQFSMVAYTDKSDKQLRRMLGLPKGVDVPQVERIPLNGLKSIIEAPDVFQHRWTVTVDNSGAPPNHKEVYPHAQEIIGKQTLIDAVRHANQFLQDAGIGLDLEEEDTPIIRGFDQSGENGNAEMDKTDYRGDPGI